MARIQQLSSHVADLIAAGEVVERPASVVKELVENAVDAGATAVTVEVRRGGMGLIRVTDNGCGIAPEELPTAFLRHATSKLRQESDLGKIGTLGFRGEALAAISAVSRLDICTCPAGALTGARLHLEGGVPGRVEETGAPQGTTVSVQDLFYNTPARLKFMKKDMAETAAVMGLMQHLALSHPEVSCQFIKDGVEALHTPGDGKLSSAVYAALGRDFAHSLVEVSGRGGEVAVHGFVTKPLAGRGSRSMQTFFVNGRFIKSPLLTAALEEGYRNQIMKGRFPGCVLHVELPVTAVDVNVHPAKTQVKFAREKEVFDAVFHTVLDALDQDGKPAAPAHREDFFKAMDAQTYRESVGGRADGVPVPSAAPRPSAPAPSGTRPIVPAAPVRPAAPAVRPASGRIVLPAQPPAWDTELSGKWAVHDTAPQAPAYRRESEFAPPDAEPLRGERAAGGEKPALAEQTAGRPPEAEQQSMPLPDGGGGDDETPWRIAGEVLKTYIICEEAGGSVWLIDKHAAHERVNFDRMKARLEPPMRQQLLSPIALGLSREDGALLLENLELLREFGFACEDFGGGSVLVREVPADIDAADAEATLEEFAENLRSGRDVDERREKLLHTMACKAAIKAGMESSEQELRVLVDRVQSGEIKYCPHGRPVAVKLSRYELEKMFKRA
ncbi:DNA mismatch repair endonuclease MutL [Oscillibacter hominis]|uniref:DNA mismatch repair protein MutL n=1 Tax=Oscillibacter hominis TaxID=2763056 RepID=A0A7G9B3W5_9FIRM|nr:DNA mismatch repair endonuclease MutL [Oscillibacter hominis]QNL44246.1 DNA mismatch repair endonuclease MutL [Oscillibacter hominis]